jgi:hypothetical protein
MSSQWESSMKTTAHSRIVAIHQPNFFPWLGFFNKIARADVFIVLDNVQFPKTGGTWMNRVRIMVDGRPAWLSIPVVRSFHGVRAISEIQISRSIRWRPRVLQRIRDSYRRAPHFATVFSFLEELINNPTDSLVEFNLAAICSLLKAFGLDQGRLMLGSSLSVTGQATDLLVSLVRSAGGTAYLCGDGAKGYQEDEKFSAANLGLIHQQFQHPQYLQFNTSEFTPGLSVIDALMNCGLERTRALVEESVLSN